MHPRALGIVLVLVFAAILVCKSLLFLVLLWSGLCLILRRANLLATHGKFAAFAVLPILFALLVVWSASQSQPPASPFDWPRSAGVGYALLVSLRVLTAGALLQGLLVPEFTAGRLPSVLLWWGLGRRGTQIVTSSITLMEDLRRRSLQVMEARTARGLMPSTRWGKVRNLPALLRPVFVSSLESAVKRAELWQHRNIDPLGLTDVVTTPPNWRMSDALLIAGAVALLLVSAGAGRVFS